MLKSYEAIFEKGSLKWIDKEPDIEDGTQVIVVVDTPSLSKYRREEIRKVLDETRGTWGSGKTLDEIDREVDAMRTASWEGDGERE